MTAASKPTSMGRHSSNRIDAIVVGAGATGGLAAYRLCEEGLSVLLLDAGGPASFWQYPLRSSIAAAAGALANSRMLRKLPPRLIYQGTKALQQFGRLRQPVQSQCYAWSLKPDALIDDLDFPYETASNSSFIWIRSNGVGGRMVVPGHGRQYYRFGDDDFSARGNSLISWPIGQSEMDPWYSLVEQHIELTGSQDGLASVPDSEIANFAELSSAEKTLVTRLQNEWPRVEAIAGRYAAPVDFVSKAAETGRLTRRSSAIVQKVLTREGRAEGVEWCDTETGIREAARAPIVFLCASSLESTRILLNSESRGRPLQESMPALGRYLNDHVMVKFEGVGAPIPDQTQPEQGQCIYLPRFNHRHQIPNSHPAFGVQIYNSQVGNKSWFTAVAFGPSEPRASNRATLSRTTSDRWGNPALRIEFDFSAQDQEMAGEMASALEKIASVAQVNLTFRGPVPSPPGMSVHECGGARMGTDAETSVLNSYNECWAVQGLFVTDGASFPSQGAQNPTLTMMALTARACAHVAHNS